MRSSQSRPLGLPMLAGVAGSKKTPPLSSIGTPNFKIAALSAFVLPARAGAATSADAPSAIAAVRTRLIGRRLAPRPDDRNMVPPSAEDASRNCRARRFEMERGTLARLVGPRIH